jgi:histidyl-tRNA synthetase
MRTTFEVVHGNLGAQNSVLGGGRYDGLAESLGSKVPAPGIGFSIGEDRLVMIVEETQPQAATVPLDLYVIPLGDAAHLRAAVIALDLRRAHKSVEVLPDGKLKRGMEIANKLGARAVLIIGEDEMASGEYALKNMLSGEQIKVKREEIEGLIGAGLST